MNETPAPSPRYDATQAQKALADPTTSPGVLVQIAQAHPHLQTAVASHPNAYPDLLHWLDQQGDPAVSQVVAQRRSMGATARSWTSAPPMTPGRTADPAAPPKHGVPGAAIAVMVAVGVVLLGLIVWFAIIPLLGNRSSSMQPGANPGASSSPASTSPPRVPSFRPIVAGGASTAAFSGVAIAEDGSVIAVGSTASTDGDFPPSHGNDDALIARYAADGTLQWAKTVGGAELDGFTGVAVAGDGSIVAVGYTYSSDGDFPPGRGGGDALIAKYSPDGTLLWAKESGGTGVDFFSSVAVGADGRIVVAGNTGSTDGDFPAVHGGEDALLAMYNPDGSLVWGITAGGSAADTFTNVAISGESSIIIAAGQTDSTDGDFPPCQGGGDAVVTRYSTNGELIWAKTGSDTAQYFASDVAIAGDDSIIVAGFTYPPASGWDSMISKYSRDGTPLWTIVSGGSGLDAFNSVAVSNDGSIVAAGFTNSNDGDMPPSVGGSDAMIAKYSPSGTLLWATRGGGTGDETYFAVTVAADDSIVAAGQTSSSDGDFSPTPGGLAVLLTNYSPNGTLRL